MVNSERKLIFETVHGSYLYGLAHEGSDRDLYRVYEGSGTSLRQSVVEGLDVVRGDLEAFLTRACSGSHQSLEALFSHEKRWAPGMREKWGPFLDDLRVSGPEVFDKYERTIRKFCYGDFKRRRHACRLRINLADLRCYGRFNPRLSRQDLDWVNAYAMVYEGDDLRKGLLGEQRT